MAEMDGQVQDFGTRRKPDILRAKDIIPSRPGMQGIDQDESADPKDIPQFNLADDIMAEQRRLSAVRRKGPLMEERRQKTEDRRPFSVVSFASSSQSYTSHWDPVLADIVARDIERLCKGGF